MRRAQRGRRGKVIGDGPERQGAHRANGLGLGAIERTWALLHRGGLGAEEGHDLMWVLMGPLRLLGGKQEEIIPGAA